MWHIALSSCTFWALKLVGEVAKYLWSLRRAATEPCPGHLLRAEQNSRSATGGGAVEGSLCLLLVRDKSGERPEFMGFLLF